MESQTQTPPEPKTPPTAVDAAIQSNDLDAFNRAELDRRQGKVTEPPADPSADAATAKPDAQAVSTETKSKPATESGEPGTKKGKLSAKERAAEVAAEVEELNKQLRLRAEVRRQLDAVEPKPKQAEKTEPASTVKEPAYKKYQAMPDAPKSADFESLDDYAAAMGVFIADKIADEKFDAKYESRSKQDRESYQRDERFAAQVEEAGARIEAEAAADPEILSRIDDRWKGLSPSDRLAEGERLTPAHFVKDRVTFHSRHTLKLSEWLTADGSKELARIAQLSPDAIIRELAYKDASFGDLAQDSPAADAPRPSQVSKASKPAPTLGRKASHGQDDLTSAIQGNDLDAFNRIELARKRGGGR